VRCWWQVKWIFTFLILSYSVHFSGNLDDITVLQQQSTHAFDMIAHDLMVCNMRGSQRYSDAHFWRSVWGLMVNVLLSGALNMVFFRVLYLALFNLFILLMMFMLMTCRFTIVLLLLIFRNFMIRLMLTWTMIGLGLTAWNCTRTRARWYLSTGEIADVPLPEVVPKVRHLGFILNKKLMPVDHFKTVGQRIYSVLRFVKQHARYELFLLESGRSWLCRW
jgi:hypothetical protein